jgi:glycosyltransferase involved in cell wall biosynthesis
VADGTRVVAVVHHFAADAPDLSAAQRARVEARDQAVLAAVDGIVTPSHWAARELERRHGLRGAWVAGPGVASAGIAPGSRGRGTPGLLALGALTPLKDQLALIRALALIRDLDWTARVVGSATADPAYAAVVRRAVGDADLGGRITLSGALTGAALEEVWRATDLLVHPSRPAAATAGLVRYGRERCRVPALARLR